MYWSYSRPRGSLQQQYGESAQDSVHMLEKTVKKMEATTEKKGVREQATHRSAESFQELKEQGRQKQCSQTAEDCQLGPEGTGTWQKE